MSAIATYRPVTPIRWAGSAMPDDRDVPAEVAVAITYNGTTHAVLMATPEHLEDFALGFAFTEGLIANPDEVESLEIVAHDNGLEARMWLSAAHARRLAARRRRMAGPTGCGLCGIESLAEASRAVPRVSSDVALRAEEVMAAVASLADQQRLNARTRAVHAAGCWTGQQGLIAVREDVGRHNALDKLIGALAGESVSQGICLLSSRISIEMVQKAAIAGFPVLAAVSAPTDAALKLAEAAGMTVIGIARRDGFEVFTRPDRIGMGPQA